MVQFARMMKFSNKRKNTHVTKYFPSKLNAAENMNLKYRTLNSEAV